MKKVLLFALIFALAGQFAYSWVKGGKGNGYMIFNPENDKDLVTSTQIDNQYYIYYIDLENMKPIKLPIVHEFALAISDKNNLLVTGVPSFSKSNFTLYNYKTGEKIFDFDQSGEIGNPNTPPYNNFLFCIDSTGKYFFSFNKKNLTLVTYDIYGKKIINTHTFNQNPNNIDQSLFLPGKNAICIVNYNGTAQFFSLFGNHETNLPNIIFSLNGSNIQPYGNDNYFTFAFENNKIFIQKIDPKEEPLSFTSGTTINDYSFTTDMKYLYYNNNYGTIFYNIKESQPTYVSNFSSNDVQTFYLDSNLTKSIVGSRVGSSLTIIGNTTAGGNILYLVDVVKHKIINTVPEAFVPSPYGLIVNNDGSLVFANSEVHYDYEAHINFYGSLVRVQDSVFKKFLHPKEQLFTFTSDSKYLVGADSSKIYFLNTETDEFDKTISNHNVSQRKVLFSTDDSRIYNIYSYGIDVYEYPSLNLIKSVKYENNDTLNILDAKNFNNVTTILTNDKIYRYALDADNLTYSPIPRISDKLKAIELSPKGDYALLYSRYAPGGGQDSFLVMNVFSNEIKYKFVHQTWADSFEIHFFGSPKRLTYSYYNGNSALFTTFLHGINLETGVEKELVGMYRAYMHPTENGYFSADDFNYYYTGLPSELIVGVKDNNTINSLLEISPNPAGDFITINLGNINPMLKHGIDVNSEILIYNTIGECVMTVEQTPSSVQQINISALPRGMYFVKVGGETAKFVKM